MNPDPAFSKDQCVDISSWPACPNCRSRDILTVSRQIKCLNCSHSGPATNKSVVFRFLEARRAILAGNPIPLQFGPFPQTVDGEFGDILGQRGMEFFQEGVFAREIFKAHRLWKEKGRFTPTALIIQQHGDAPSVMPLAPPICDSLDIARRMLFDQAHGSSAVAVFFPSPALPSLDFNHPDYLGPKDQQEYLAVNVHCFGSKAIAGRLLRNGSSIEWDREQSITEVIWQPIDWALLLSGKSSEMLRYAAAIEIAGDVNINLVVAEGMDGGVRAQISYRDPLDTISRSVSRFPYSTVEEAIDKMKMKFAAMVQEATKQSSDQIAQNFELEWGMECNRHAIIHQLRAAMLRKDGQVH